MPRNTSSSLQYSSSVSSISTWSSSDFKKRASSGAGAARLSRAPTSGAAPPGRGRPTGTASGSPSSRPSARGALSLTRSSARTARCPRERAVLRASSSPGPPPPFARAEQCFTHRKNVSATSRRSTAPRLVVRRLGPRVVAPATAAAAPTRRLVVRVRGVFGSARGGRARRVRGAATEKRHWFFWRSRGGATDARRRPRQPPPRTTPARPRRPRSASPVSPGSAAPRARGPSGGTPSPPPTSPQSRSLGRRPSRRRAPPRPNPDPPERVHAQESSRRSSPGVAHLQPVLVRVVLVLVARGLRRQRQPRVVRDDALASHHDAVREHGALPGDGARVVLGSDGAQKRRRSRASRRGSSRFSARTSPARRSPRPPPHPVRASSPRSLPKNVP